MARCDIVSTMNPRVVIPFVMALLVAGVTPALAQSTRKVGLVMGYPASVGVLWDVSERIGLRPDFSITRQSAETTSTVSGIIGMTETSTTTSEGWTTSLGLSGLFYLGAPADLRFYLTPRVAWAWSRSDYEASQGLVQLGPIDSESDGFLVAGSFGAQYAPHERFRLFGELGLSYSQQEGTTGYSVSRADTSTTSVGLRSGVGVVVYF